MDKTLILATAGSGKTYHIVEQLDDLKRVLLITYTTSNIENLRNSIIAKFGYLPNNIKIKSYFTFLYSFCYKPFLVDEIISKGIFWKYPPEFSRNFKRASNTFYLSKDKFLYHNRIAKLIIEKNIIIDVKQRLEKYYDYLYIDEIQDFGGHDFNLLSEVSKSNIDILFVGDFFQHTFTTSNDGIININLHGNLVEYLQRFKKLGFTIDNCTLLNSRRCSRTICDFIREKIGIEIYSYFNKESDLMLITNEIEADRIFRDDKIIKLFLKEHYKYDCYSDNWGSCKGLEFENVCIVISDDILKLYKNNDFRSLKPLTKNKLYVACSRSKNNLYFVPMGIYKKYKKK